MSELITRRTFLKATGAAALAVAASGMLAGCGDGADALLSVSVLPSVSSESYIFADTGYMIGLGSFEDCRSNSQREPGTNSTQHYYLYTAVPLFRSRTFQTLSLLMLLTSNLLLPILLLPAKPPVAALPIIL